MHRLAALLLAFVLSIIATAASADPLPVPVVRVLSPRLAQTLCDAARVSPTLRALLHALERSDLIVHVTGRSPVTSARVSRRLAGTMHLIAVTPTRRFLRITVDESLSPNRRAAVLAHELWHALEVARAPHVVDRRSFEALYQHIGHRSFGMSSWYDTRGAVAAGDRVFEEIRRQHMSH